MCCIINCELCFLCRVINNSHKQFDSILKNNRIKQKKKKQENGKKYCTTTVNTRVDFSCYSRVAFNFVQLFRKTNGHLFTLSLPTWTTILSSMCSQCIILRHFELVRRWSIVFEFPETVLSRSVQLQKKKGERKETKRKRNRNNTLEHIASVQCCCVRG